MHSPDPRGRILRAAAQLYAETGFRGATTRRIAQLAGVNEITLFRHFGSKTRLLHEAIRCAGTTGNLCGLPDRPENPRKELGEWAWSSYQELHARRSLIRTAMGEMGERPEMLPAENSATVCAGRALARYLEQLKTRGLARAEFDLTAATTMFMGTLFTDAISRDIMPMIYDRPPEQAIEQYVDLFLRALGVAEDAGS